jgi:hypothetical protein
LGVQDPSAERMFHSLPFPRGSLEIKSILVLIFLISLFSWHVYFSGFTPFLYSFSESKETVRSGVCGGNRLNQGCNQSSECLARSWSFEAGKNTRAERELLSSGTI